jgi:hypothetical protein
MTPVVRAFVAKEIIPNATTGEAYLGQRPPG